MNFRVIFAATLTCLLTFALPAVAGAAEQTEINNGQT